MSDRPYPSANAQAPVCQKHPSEASAPRSPSPDHQLIEKLAHESRGRLPERIVHAKGWGAHGTFTVTNDITCYSCADIFSAVGKTTPVIVRFSNAAGDRDSADTERDVRGFAVKFYTDDGNWDVVGNNTPVFFFRDPYKFASFVHTQKRDPKTSLRAPTAMWDLWSRSPEALHQITILMSDRGLPRTARHMNGYGGHTFSLLNADNGRFWVKFHFKTLQGHQHWTDAEAREVAGNRDWARDDLRSTIQRGDFPQWRLCIQVMPETDAERLPDNPFDLTKVWPQSDYPLIEVGILELNRVPDDCFAEVEQAAFAPSNIVPGIGLSPDKMLQARIFSYADAHRYRLGAHYRSLPVNAPKSQASSDQREIPTRSPAGSPNADAHGSPGTFDDAARSNRYREQPLKVPSDDDRYGIPVGGDDFGQAGALFRLMSADAQARLMDNIARAMRGVPDEIVRRQLALFYAADPAYGSGLAERLRQASETLTKPLPAA